ncbi:MAG: hypothetical protein IH888_08880, partial [Planctomycetes bacterium]|nr:hypothetical protein [Planctomycetota bacterium]
MGRRLHSHSGALWLLLACALGVCPGAMASWQADQPPGGAGEPETETLIRFNFKGATFDQVIDFFARATGLPVVREADLPDGTLDYLAPEEYTIPEALEILNIILQARGVTLRASDDMLYLQKLSEMQREDIPTYVGELPADVRPSEIITVVCPLSIAMAKPLAEKLAVMVAEYGSLTAMEQQNSLVITETAAQVRRLLKIIDVLDREDPEDAVEIIALRHSKAAALMEPLKALLSKRVEKFVTDQKGKQVKVSEETMPGLNISFDERTNTIIAKGVQSRIDKLKEAILLLDVPASAGARMVHSFSLLRLAPQDALGKLQELFAKLPEPERPTLLALDEVGKVTLVGTSQAIEEASSLLRDIDGDAFEPSAPQRTIAVVPLEHADPEAVAATARALLNGRQLVASKMIPAPDGRSLIVAGPAADVRTIQTLLSLLDQPAAVQRRVRLLRLATGEPRQVVDRARGLYEKQVDPESPQWAVAIELDEAARILTLAGGAAALEKFVEALRMVEANTVIDRETRQIDVTYATPSRLVGPLSALAAKILKPRDGAALVAPVIEPLDPLHALIVTALPEHVEVLESLIATLDRPAPEDFQFRVIALTGADSRMLIEKADYIYKRISYPGNPTEWPPPVVELDEVTGNLLLSGHTEAVATYERAVAEARKLLPPARTGRLIELRNAKASEVIGPLLQLIATTAHVDPARSIPEPTLKVIERTNSLYVVAEPAQHDLIQRHIKRLDTFEPTQLPPLRLLQVRAADAAQLASMIRKRYDSRPAEQRREQPVEIDVDTATNTLIVTTGAEIFQEIKQLIDTVNESGQLQAERETMLFPLKRARAADLAQALDRLYPQPPMPLDRRGRPLPHLQKPKEVHVSPEVATNTLIIEAPAERRAQFEALVAQLDRVQLPPQAELRTYHIERGDVTQIARTLNDLARRGILSAPPTESTKPVDVTIQAEPVSRTLIVAGDHVTFETTERMLADLKAVPIKRSLRVLEVTGTDPTQIADQALRLYGEQTADDPDATTVSVEVDRENATLLVIADDEAMFRFVSIFNELAASIGPPPDVRLIALEYAEADQVVDFLRDLATSGLAVMAGRRGTPPLFEAIGRTNSILIAAQPDQQQIIRGLVEGLDKPEMIDMPPLRILQLRTADAQNLSNALMRQYSKRHPDQRQERPVTISADPNTNSLIVAAHPDLLPEIQAVVESFNRADLFGAEGREIRIFPLKIARAEELARTIDEMFPPPPVPRDRRGRPLYNLQQPREIVVRGDRQTNALIVDAPIQRMAGFEKLVEQLDRQEIAAETEIRTYRLLNADLAATARTLQQLVTSGSLSPQQRNQRVATTISTEPVTRTLIVSGAVDIFDRVEGVLSELDARPIGPATSLRFFRLSNARAESLVPMLREVLLRRIAEDVQDAGPDPAAHLSISADRKTNTLIISAPQAIMSVADSLVTELDHPRAAVDVLDIRIFQLTQADAASVATAVRTALEAQTEAEGLTERPIITPEPSSNSVVVTATPQQMQRIEALIGSLDGALPAGQLQVRTVFLKHARAESVAPLVEELLAREELLDVNQLPSWARVNYMRARMERPEEPTVRVAADLRLNAVVISATATLLNIAEQMVAQLDVDMAMLDGVARRSVRVLVIENADAQELATNLAAIFADTDQLDPAPTIRVDSASNSLLVMATDRQFATIEQVAGEIDQATISTARQMRLIPIDPATASASELAEMLRRMLDRRGRSRVEIISLQELLKRRRPQPPPKV